MRSSRWPSADLSRRGALALLAGGLSAALAGCVTASGGPPLQVSALIVDVGPFRDKGMSTYADMTGELLAAAAREHFAVGPQGPRVRLVVNSVSTFATPGAGEDDLFGGASVAPDQADGHVVVETREGVRRIPILVSRTPRSLPPVWTPEFERARVFDLMTSFAAWAKAEVARAL